MHNQSTLPQNPKPENDLLKEKNKMLSDSNNLNDTLKSDTSKKRGYTPKIGIPQTIQKRKTTNNKKQIKQQNQIVSEVIDQNKEIETFKIKFVQKKNNKVKFDVPEEQEIPTLEKLNLQVNNKLKHQELDFIFYQKDNKDQEQLYPYHQDGDPKMYTEEMLEKRKLLKENEEVVKSINNLISLFIFDKNDNLRKYEYTKIFLRISFILRRDLYENRDKVSEVKNILEQDWVKDSQNKSFLNKNELFDSLFELGDIWTPHANQEEYVSFFETLKHKIILDEQERSNEEIYKIIVEN